MSAFWNVIVSNAQWMFGSGGALLLLGVYLLRQGRSHPARPTQHSRDGTNIGGDVVSGNKTTGVSTGLMALVLGAVLCLAALAILTTGGGNRAVTIGSGVANTGDGNTIQVSQ